MMPIAPAYRLLLAASAAGIYLLLYWSTWVDMERVWSSSATYNHCYLIIPIALYLFYRAKAPEPLAQPPSNSWLILPAVALMLMQLVWLLGYAADLALLMHAAAVITLQALIWLSLGNVNSYQHRFAIFYLAFLIPFGEELSPLLQNITADHTVTLLKAVNIPVFREGLFLATPVGMFEVAEACSGLRFLIAALAISVLFAYLHYNTLWKQIAFVSVMAFLSILANGVRAFMLVYIGETSGMKYGFGADHFVYGWLFFGIVLLAGFWVGARFADPVKPLVRSVAKHFTVQLTPGIFGCALLALLVTYIFSQTLNITHVTSAQSNVEIDKHSNDWGIHFPNALSVKHTQLSSSIDYFQAEYANKQTRGELINWDNTLFDKKRWQVQKSIVAPQYTVLQLKSLNGSYRTILYWYQVGTQRTHGGVKTKLLQALAYLKDDSSTACIVAVSSAGMATAAHIAELSAAATASSVCGITQQAENAEAARD